MINRDYYLQQLVRNRHNHLAKVITGLRRVGKSFLLNTIFKNYLLEEGVQEDHIIKMAFDNFEFREYRNPERFYEHVKEQIKDEEMYYLLLDEVQLLENFVDVLNGFLYMPNVDVYVTGSNARFLSSDVITEFRGRGVEIHINPLSFKEVMTIRQGDRHSIWQEYMLYGSLPMVVLESSKEGKVQMLASLIKETYLNDILSRNRIKNNAEIETLFSILSSGVGSLTNPQKLSNTFRSERHIEISPETINRYIDYFIDSFLVEKSLRYDVKGKKYISTPSKYYFTDVGLRNALIGFRQVEPAHLMENIIYNELRYRGYSVDVGAIEAFSKDTEGKTVRTNFEIDFVCNKGGERLYVQSAFSIPDEDKMEQEQRSLVKVGDEFRKIIVTADNIPSHTLSNGIELINLYDFLLK